MKNELSTVRTWLAASVYVNTGLKLPLSAGTPLSRSVALLTVNPAASCPAVCRTVYGPVPPRTRKVCE